MNKKLKLIVGVTGASGSMYAQKLFHKLIEIKEQINCCDVVFSDCGKQVWEYELKNKDYLNLPFTLFDKKNFFAPFASGSADYDAMIICPCSMGTLGRIASGVSDDLISRAADVMLKERKKLIMVAREMPLNLIHINNMKTITESGGIICPASPSFYNHPKTIDDAINTVIDKILKLAGLDIKTFEWGEKNLIIPPNNHI